jgi:2-C-methyl-D-erythritol 4-phosphate cytidylyltransferase
MSVFSAIILGAGTGNRMHGIDKIMTNICGLPVILHSVDAFLRSGIFETMTVVANAYRMQYHRQTTNVGHYLIDAMHSVSCARA